MVAGGETSSQHGVVVVGAGSSGIATALALGDVGIRALVLDQADRIASSWRARYDRLRLNTCRPFSHLPDRRFPKGTPMFPTRDQLVQHIERHARDAEFDLRLGTRVERIDTGGNGWRLRTSAGEIFAAQLVVATGYERVPFIPEWSGRDRFEGRLLHASEYRNPAPFQGSKVLVVGPGCSGMEIAYDLAYGGAAKVWLSARTPPNILLREAPGGLPGDVLGVALLRLPIRLADGVARFARRMDLGDLTGYGLPVPEEGVFSRMARLGVAPSIIDREVIDAIKAGRIEVVRGVDSLDSNGVSLDDGVRVEPDAVVCATGYRRGLETLVGHLGVLGEYGAPRTHGVEAAVAGLRFIGYVQRPGGLGYMAKEAKRAARAIARELRLAAAIPR